MRKKTFKLEVNFHEAMRVYFSADISLRLMALKIALMLGSSWEDFEEYLPVTFHNNTEKGMFLNTALNFAETYQNCESICLWAWSIGARDLVDEVVQKMVQLAHAPEHWQFIARCAREGSKLEALALETLANYGALADRVTDAEKVEAVIVIMKQMAEEIRVLAGDITIAEKMQSFLDGAERVKSAKTREEFQRWFVGFSG